MLGYRKDIPELNCSADVFCFPSYREGLGLAAIEAMYCGLPIVTSNVHGINDYSDDGVTGYKYAPTDLDGFACGLLNLKNDAKLRQNMSEHNMILSERYGIEKVKPLIREIYESEMRGE